MEDIEKFVSGFARFQQQYFNEQQTLYDNLRAGQRPTLPWSSAVAIRASIRCY